MRNKTNKAYQIPIANPSTIRKQVLFSVMNVTQIKVRSWFDINVSRKVVHFSFYIRISKPRYGEAVSVDWR